MEFFKRKTEIPEEQKQELLGRVEKALAGKLKISEKELTPHARFKEDLSFESFDTIEATIALEEEFSIEIPDEDAEKLLTIDDVVRYLYTRRSKQN